ncbi:hypothetical protein VKT23_005067 [Stygiomarasmius scandens]|uniref:Uncharacterized protein n=1 Tax=Marasmiellus scandens TaxID=2682957 RepID=A0ABR1JSM2_9AGAR
MQGCWKRDVSARPKAKVLPDQLLVAADQKFEMKPAENLFDNTFGDSLPYQLWRSIRHPELCPSGSDLEEFLFRSWSTTDIPKENDIPLSGRNESTPAATYLDDHPLVSGQFAEDVDLQNDLKEIMDKALDEKIKDIAGTLNCNGAYNPVTSISSDAHHHPITGSNNSTPMLSSAHQVFNGRLSSGFTSLRARNSYSTNTELSDSFLNGLRFLH